MIGNGWIMTLLVLLPNSLFAVFPPSGAPQKSVGKSTPVQNILTLFETLGRAFCFFLPVFGRLDMETGLSRICLIAGIVCLAMYYGCWLRYFLSGRKYSLLYAPLFIIPLPMAVFPVLLFFLSGVFLGLPIMFAAAGILGAGHFYNTAREKKRLETGG